jgi:hypothetical protein
MHGGLHRPSVPDKRCHSGAEFCAAPNHCYGEAATSDVLAQREQLRFRFLFAGGDACVDGDKRWFAHNTVRRNRAECCSSYSSFVNTAGMQARVRFFKYLVVTPHAGFVNTQRDMLPEAVRAVRGLYRIPGENRRHALQTADVILQPLKHR